MPQVLDYSSGFPGADAIARAGYVGAVRYIGSPGNPKCTTLTELEDFEAHGLGMALVYEHTEGDFRGGFAGGQAAATAARAHADSVGFPPDRPVYFAIDQDVVTDADFALAADYIRGACSVLTMDRTGVYGEFDVCARIASTGYARFYWQTRAWSRAQRFAGHLYQSGDQADVAGVQCDLNTVTSDDWGQHPAPESSDMTPDQANRLIWCEQTLRTISNQLTGNAHGDPIFDSEMKPVTLTDWGWTSKVDNATRFSMVDFVRYVDLATNQTRAKVDEISAKLDQVLAGLGAK